MKAVAGNYVIQTVSRALELLEQFQEGDAELGITELSNRLNLQKNNVFRLVVTLKAKSYIEMNNATGKYRLGIKTRALGMVARRVIDFASHAYRIFCSSTGKAVLLCSPCFPADAHAVHDTKRGCADWRNPLICVAGLTGF